MTRLIEIDENANYSTTGAPVAFSASTTQGRNFNQFVTGENVAPEELRQMMACEPEVVPALLESGQKTDWAFLVNSMDHSKQFAAIKQGKNARYELLKNSDLLDTVELLCNAGLFRVKRAGVYNHGAGVAVSGEIIGCEGIPDDPHRAELTFLNSHDAKSSLRLIGGMMRMNCKNQIPGLIGKGKEALSIKIAHNSSIQSRFAEASTFIRHCAENSASMFDKIKALRGVYMTDRLVEETLDIIQPRTFDALGKDVSSTRCRNIRNAVKRLEATGPAAVNDGTAYSFLQGVTAYYTHGEGSRSATESGLSKWSAWTGSAHNKAANAVSHLVELI